MIQLKKFTTQLAFMFSFALFTTTAFAQQINDKDIKKDITAIDNALNRLIKLEPKEYMFDAARYNYQPKEKGRHYGFIAEDLALVFPELVAEKNVQYMFGKNAYRTAKVKTVDESSLIPVLVASIKEQQAQIEKLKQEVEALKNNKSVAIQ